MPRETRHENFLRNFLRPSAVRRNAQNYCMQREDVHFNIKLGIVLTIMGLGVAA